MKHQISYLAIAALLVSSSAIAKETHQTPDPKMVEMMKKYEEAATPGEPHKMLAALKGTWKTTSQMWEAPDSKPEVSKGTAKFNVILGGRWVQQDFKGTAMGKPFRGMGLVGFDNVTGKYTSHWFDDMSTSSMKAEGDYDATTKTIKDKASISSPVSPTKKQEVRSEWQMLSKNKMIFTMYGSKPEGGPEFKMMEVVYTR